MATGFSADNTSEEYHEHSCMPCTADGRNKRAVKYCKVCCEDFCLGCLKDHNKFSAMRLHDVVDIENKPDSTPIKVVHMERCASHNGKPVDTYCRQHNAVGCTTCISINHRSCTDVTGILDMAKGMKISGEYEAVLNNIAECKSELEELKKIKQEHQKQLDKEKSKCLSQIQRFRKAINKHLDDLENTVRTDLYAKHKQFTDAVNADIDDLGQAITTLEESLSQLNEPTDDESQAFAIFKMGKEKEINANKLIQRMQTSLRKNTLDFKTNKSMTYVLDNVKSIGNIIMDKDKDIVYAATNQGLYHVGTKAKTSNILGYCNLQDGTILLADFENELIIRADQSFKAIDNCKMPGQPAVICVVDSGEIAVSLTFNQMIQLVSIGPKMLRTSSFKTGECCRGIAFSNGTFIVACGGGSGGGKYTEGPGQVRTFSREGCLLRIVQTNIVGEPLFTLPRRIVVSLDHSLYHVTDRQKGIISIDTLGQEQSQFSDPQIKSTLGICLGPNGQLFVCDTDSESVLQFNSSGKKVGVLIDKSANLSNPHLIHYNSSDSSLVVLTRTNNTLAVYDLEQIPNDG